MSQWIVWRLLLLLIILLLFHLQHLCSLCKLHIVFVHALIIHLHISLSPISSLNLFFNLSLPPIVRFCLPFLCRLAPHPIAVALSILLVSHLTFKFLPPVKFSHMRYLLSFIKLFLHKPVVHSFYPIFELLSLRLCHM